ncbi:hypothetical protein FJ364_02770 [Candidatus Dependentiae bacterium]|nr:hypothetical protein [Candidatus Dependentiae bacterium]
MNHRTKKAQPPRVNFSNRISNSKLIKVSYNVTWDPIHIEQYPAEIDKNLEKIYDLVHKNPHLAIESLTSLIAKYPDIPVLWNYHIAAYQLLKRDDEANELIVESYKRFPDYLFAKCTYAHMCIKKKDLQRSLKFLITNLI